MSNLDNREYIFETLISSAVSMNAMRELDELPSEAELQKQLILSKSFDKRIKHIIIREKSTRIFKTFRKVAACILIIFSILFSTILMSSKDVQAAVIKVVVDVFDKFTKFSFFQTSGEANDRLFIVSYIPEGFKQSSYTQTGAFTKIRYEDESYRRIVLVYSNGNGDITTELDNENIIYKVIKYNKLTLYVFLSEDNSSENQVIWESDGHVFNLMSSVSIDEMYNIIDGIKLVKK